MASNKKELCPVCKTNMKGVDAKMCQPCNRATFTKRVAESKANDVQETVQDKPPVGATTPDGKYYL